MSVRVRFAPSPTGFLHIGGARTALFNYLFAKKMGGEFVLRVEDTDKERSTDASTQAILDGMQWLGLQWDEGPFFQSQRGELYQKAVDHLLAEGKAYKCFLTKEELEARKAERIAQGLPPRYDGRESQLENQSQDKPFVVRFKVPAGRTTVDDVIKGPATFSNEEIEDFVLLRSDGSPTYNLVVVVDDFDMRISHVIRGDDHLNNTPKQILLYQALGYALPVFAHVPLILGKDRQRLSKRHGATSVMAYRDMGYLPEAMINFLVRLGWSHQDQEIFSKTELHTLFNLEHVGISAGVFNEEKLIWLNQHYIKEAPFEVLKQEISYFITPDRSYIEEPDAEKVVDLLRDRAKTTKELAELSRFYFNDELTIPAEMAEKFVKSESLAPLAKLTQALETLDTFSESEVKPVFDRVLSENGLKFKQLGQPLRIVLTASPFSPGIFELLEVLGKKRSLQRLQQYLEANQGT